MDDFTNAYNYHCAVATMFLITANNELPGISMWFSSEPSELDNKDSSNNHLLQKTHVWNLLIGYYTSNKSTQQQQSATKELTMLLTVYHREASITSTHSSC